MTTATPSSLSTSGHRQLFRSDLTSENMEFRWAKEKGTRHLLSRQEEHDDVGVEY